MKIKKHTLLFISVIITSLTINSLFCAEQKEEFPLIEENPIEQIEPAKESFFTEKSETPQKKPSWFQRFISKPAVKYTAFALTTGLILYTGAINMGYANSPMELWKQYFAPQQQPGQQPGQPQPKVQPTPGVQPAPAPGPSPQPQPGPTKTISPDDFNTDNDLLMQNPAVFDAKSYKLDDPSPSKTADLQISLDLYKKNYEIQYLKQANKKTYNQRLNRVITDKINKINQEAATINIGLPEASLEKGSLFDVDVQIKKVPQKYTFKDLKKTQHALLKDALDNLEKKYVEEYNYLLKKSNPIERSNRIKKLNEETHKQVEKFVAEFPH